MEREQSAFKDPHAILRAALSDLVSAGLDTFTKWLQRQPAAAVDYSDPRIIADTFNADDAAADAADLLGVAINARAADVRAAFRAKVKDRMAAGAFHDQRGGATDRDAQELIEAKNLLIERSEKERTNVA